MGIKQVCIVLGVCRKLLDLRITIDEWQTRISPRKSTENHWG